MPDFQTILSIDDDARTGEIKIYNVPMPGMFTAYQFADDMFTLPALAHDNELPGVATYQTLLSKFTDWTSQIRRRLSPVPGGLDKYDFVYNPTHADKVTADLKFGARKVIDIKYVKETKTVTVNKRADPVSMTFSELAEWVATHQKIVNWLSYEP